MKEKTRVLELTSDVVFKSFMLSEETKEYSARLISLITKIPEEEVLKNAVFNNIEIPIRNKKDKRYKADIIITVMKNIINIEMNKEYYEGIFSKNNAYTSRIYGDQFDIGDNYIKIKKIIGINIDNFSRFKGNKFLYKFLPLEEETKEIEDDLRETYHLDLEYLRKKCYNKEKLSELERMCQIFIEEDSEELDELKRGDRVMEKAVNKLEEISRDEKIIGLYDAEAVERKVWNTKLLYAEKLGTERGMKKGIEKGIRQGIKQGIEQGIEKGIEQGIEQGIEKGKQQGLEQGKKDEQLEIARNMLVRGMDKELIMELTNISEEELDFLIS